MLLIFYNMGKILFIVLKAAYSICHVLDLIWHVFTKVSYPLQEARDEWKAQSSAHKRLRVLFPKNGRCFYSNSGVLLNISNNS